MNGRKNEIIEFVNQHGTVSFKEIKDLFPQVSDMTLRRDLDALDQEHSLVRVHGGAKSISTIVGAEDLFGNRAVTHIEEKRVIAQKALSCIIPDCAIFFDSGSTIAELAKILPDESMLIFTGNLAATLDMARLQRPQIYIISGKLNSQSLCVSGISSMEMLSDININYAFFGATGYSESRGFTCGTEEEYKLKKEIAKRSDKIIILMDSSKVGISSIYTYATEENVDLVISDGNLPVRIQERFQRNGVEIL